MLKAIGVFFIVLIGILLTGYVFYLKSENPVHLLIFAHIGLILAFVFSKRSIPKKVIPHKNPDITS